MLWGGGDVCGCQQGGVERGGGGDDGAAASAWLCTGQLGHHRCASQLYRVCTNHCMRRMQVVVGAMRLAAGAAWQCCYDMSHFCSAWNLNHAETRTRQASPVVLIEQCLACGCAVVWCQVITLHEAGQRGSALASAIMEHAGSLVSLAGETSTIY
jgi:hypothetical protein